jgi:hypothetical protein
MDKINTKAGGEDRTLTDTRCTPDARTRLLVYSSRFTTKLHRHYQ